MSGRETLLPDDSPDYGSMDTYHLVCALWAAAGAPRGAIEEAERRLNEAEETSAFIGSKGLGDEFMAWALARRAEVEKMLDYLTVPIRDGGALRVREALEYGEQNAVFAAFRDAGSISIIRSLGFIGNSHYCPDCMVEFHARLGQHEPGCERVKELREERDDDGAVERRS